MLNIVAPNLLQKVLCDSLFIQSLDTKEKEVLQLIVDFLIYDHTGNITETNEQLIALFLLDTIYGEAVDLKKQVLESFVSQITLRNTLDIIDNITKYLHREKKFFKDSQSTYLEQLKEYCFDVIAVNLHTKEFEEYIEKDERLMNYWLVILKRKTISKIRKVNFDETPKKLPTYPLAEIFQNKSFSDFELTIDGSQVLKLHKTVLASSSVYFETLFNSEWQNLSAMEVYPEEMLYIIKYCYGIRETIPAHLIIQVVHKAHEHEMIELVSQLTVTADNFLEIVQIFRDGNEDDEMFSSIREKLVNFMEPQNAKFISDNY